MKPKSRYLSFLSILILIILIPLNADEVPIKFDHLTVADGLIHNAVLSIYQDSRGFLWLGTEFGLSCYDGFKFHRYTHDPGNPNSLSNPFVFDIVEDKEGMMWIATQNGLNRFNCFTQRFEHFAVSFEHPHSFSLNWTYRLLLDQEGKIWAGTPGNGLSRFDPHTTTFTHHYTHDPDKSDSISNNCIEDLYMDKQGIFWVCTRNGINRLDQKTGKFSRFIPDTSDRRKRLIICLLEDKDGHFWAGTASGLFGFDAKTGHFAPVFKGVRSAPGLNSDQIIVLKEDLFGNLWVGTRFGLHRIDLQTKQVTRYQYNPRDLRGINENHIMDLLVDSNGLLWVATYGGGLNKIIFQTKPFGFHPFEPDQVKGLSYRSILSIIEDKAGIVWLGTRGGGTNRWDRTTNQFRHYKRDPGNPNSIISDDIPIIIESKVEPGVLWLGTRSGLDRFDANSETFTHYYHNPEQDDSLSSRFVYALLEDRSGTLWVGTWGKGLNRFHRDTRTFTRYLPDRHNPSSISSNVIWDIHEDRQGHLWIGTGGGGLNRMDVKAGSFRCYRNQPENPDSLSNNHILSIHEDSNGFLWIGTLGGVNRFNPDTAECDRYSVKDGLPDNVIYGILEDNQGDLWFSTNKGLSRFNPKTKTFRNYSPQDGLQGYEFNQHSYFKNEQGELYFGGVNGFNVFYSHKILDNKNIPPVVFTDFKIFNRPVLIKPEGGSPLKSSILETNSITLPYNQHSISFEFSALDFTHPDRNQYAYKLDDINDDWIYLGNKNDINFANLAPGTYRLWVKGTNSDGIWNEQGTSIEIIITPPFWETWWFRGIMVLVVIILISILHLLRMRHITEKLKSEAVVERFFNKKGISSREREIILLILKGMSNKQIEDELYISLGTVKNHAFNIYKKLQINSRVQLVTLFKNLLPSVKQDQEMRRSQEDGGR